MYLEIHEYVAGDDRRVVTILGFVEYLIVFDEGVRKTMDLVIFRRKIITWQIFSLKV